MGGNGSKSGLSYLIAPDNPMQLELSDDWHNFYLPSSVKNKFGFIENIKTYNDLKRYLSSNNIELDTDLKKLSGQRADDDIPAVREQAQRIVVGIETFKDVFGENSLSKLKKISLYNNDIPYQADYTFNVLGENDPDAGLLRLKDWNVDGRMIFHELAHVYQDSMAGKNQDALIFSDMVQDEIIKFHSNYKGHRGNTVNAEMLADVISYGFTRGGKGTDYDRQVIMALRKLKRRK